MAEGAPPGRRRDGVNSHEVARLAGVSQATVSRVINGYVAVREDTRRRVEAAMLTLGYVPNAAARSLITHQTQLLGLVVSNITNGFYPEIIEAITARAVDVGYTVILGSAGERVASQARYLRLLGEQRVDGIILTSTLVGEAPQLEALVAAGMPIVLANRIRGDLPVDSIALDNPAAGLAATSHLLGHGRRAIAYVGGRRDAPTDRDRYAGYRAAHRLAGLPVRRTLVSHGEFTRDYGYRRTLELARAGGIDGVVAGDDTVALGCLDALADAGLGVPADVSVIGFDDIPAASLRGISLTTISASSREMGSGALGLLLDRIGGRAPASPRRVVLPANLVLRGSCGPHSTDQLDSR